MTKDHNLLNSLSVYAISFSRPKWKKTADEEESSQGTNREYCW